MSQTRTQRNAPLAVTVALVVLGAALILVSILYFTRTAADLPTFFPGHQAGSVRHHAKHGLIALILGVLACAGAWISLGSKSASGT